MKYDGIMTALVTPFDGSGKLDEKGLRDLIKFQTENNVDSILVLGGTGEYTALNNATRKNVIDIAVDEVDGKLPVVVGIITPGLGDAIEIGDYSKQAGVNAIMVVTPYYVHPGQEGIIEFHSQIDKEVGLPQILYNIPYRTCVNMLPETVEKLVDMLDNIVGIKECTPSLSQAADLIKRVGHKIPVLCGEEFYAVSEFIFGARGAVLASANVIPSFWVKVFKDVKEGRVDEAVTNYLKHYRFFEAIFSETNPGPLKKAMEIAGLPGGSVSTPLVKPMDSTVNKLRTIMMDLNIV